MQSQALLNYNFNKTTPLTVIMLVIDSMSRSHFYRRLPKTLKFLNSTSPKNITITDFKLHNIIGSNSIPNVYSVLTGRPYLPMSSETQEKNSEKTKDLLGKDAI